MAVYHHVGARLESLAEAAVALGEREMAAAHTSGDGITLTRSLMSNGTNKIVGGDTGRGLGLLKEARSLFDTGQSDDHRQGLGWYWILRADREAQRRHEALAATGGDVTAA